MDALYISRSITNRNYAHKHFASSGLAELIGESVSGLAFGKEHCPVGIFEVGLIGSEGVFAATEGKVACHVVAITEGLEGVAISCLHLDDDTLNFVLLQTEYLATVSDDACRWLDRSPSGYYFATQ